MASVKEGSWSRGRWSKQELPLFARCKKDADRRFGVQERVIAASGRKSLCSGRFSQLRDRGDAREDLGDRKVDRQPPDAPCLFGVFLATRDHGGELLAQRPDIASPSVGEARPGSTGSSGDKIRAWDPSRWMKNTLHLALNWSDMGMTYRACQRSSMLFFSTSPYLRP